MFEPNKFSYPGPKSLSPLELPDWTKSIRMSSWDIKTLYPDYEQWRQKAKTLAAAGVNAVTLFWFAEGREYRHIIFDSAIYEIDAPELGFNKIYEVLKNLCDICHNEGIKVINHHGFAFVHYNEKSDIYRHKIEDLSYNGHPMKNWLCVDASTMGESMGVYGGYMLCPNNPDFKSASAEIIKNFIECGVDGMMPDDIAFAPNYYTCVCQHCQAAFKQNYGVSVPPKDNLNFWGNFESQDFRNWLNFRLDSTTSYHRYLAEAISAHRKAFLYYACSCSVASVFAAQNQGWSYDRWIEAANATLHENVNWNVYKYNYALNCAEEKINKAIARRTDAPSINLMYPHFPDDYFNCWAQTKLLGSYLWGGYGHYIWQKNSKDKAILRTPPGRQEEAVGAIYQWEKQYEEYFQSNRDVVCSIALLFSPATRNYYGGNDDKYYANEFLGWSEMLIRNNILFEVVLPNDLKDDVLQKYKLLIMPNSACMSEAEVNAIKRFCDQGNNIIASYESSLYDEYGRRHKDFALADIFGVSYEDKVAEITADVSFSPDSDLYEDGTIKTISPRIVSRLHPNTELKAKFTGEFDWLPGIRCAVAHNKDQGESLWFGFKPGLSVFTGMVSSRAGTDRQSLKFNDLLDHETEQMLVNAVNIMVKDSPVKINCSDGIISNCFAADNGFIIHLLNMQDGLWMNNKKVSEREVLQIKYPKLEKDIEVEIAAHYKVKKAKILLFPQEKNSELQIKDNIITIPPGKSLHYALIFIEL